MLPLRLSILGVGLLGGSIGLAARANSIPCHITGYGHRKQTLDKALEVGAIDRACEDAGQAVTEADLVIICTPVGLFEQILRQISPHLKKGAVVTDVGSTKRSIVRLAGKLLGRGVEFVGSHPMAGSEKRSVEFAKADLFANALCILTPTAKTDPQAVEKVEEFWKSLGMRLTRMTPTQHDRYLADISHLPHAAAAALVMMQTDAALMLAGKGFLDTTRIAGGDGALWRDIFLDNRDNLKSAIRRLIRNLEGLSGLLEDDKSEKLRQWLDQSAGRRQALLQKKLSEMTPD
jgi:prephenate dehydrogenase